MSGGVIPAALLLLAPLAFAQSNASGQRPDPPKAPRMSSDEVMARLEKGEVFFLDVREPKELQEMGTLEGYVNIPIGEIEKRLADIPKDQPIVTA
jgi:hypothetical protein